MSRDTMRVVGILMVLGSVSGCCGSRNCPPISPAKLSLYKEDELIGLAKSMSSCSPDPAHDRLVQAELDRIAFLFECRDESREHWLDLRITLLCRLGKTEEAVSAQNEAVREFPNSTLMKSALNRCFAPCKQEALNQTASGKPHN